MNNAQFEDQTLNLFRQHAAQTSHFSNPIARGVANLLMERVQDEAADPMSADYARRLHERIEKQYGAPAHGGFYAPFADRVFDASSGSALISSELANELIPSLTPFSGVIAAGARIIVINEAGSFAFPRIATGATVSVTLDGNIATAGDPTTDQVLLTSFGLSSTCYISRRLKGQMASALEAALIGDLQRRAFAEVDRLIISGSGSGEPTGILNNSNVSLYAAGTDGAAPSLAILADMEYDLGTTYAEAGSKPVWFTNSAVRRAVRKTATAAGIAPMWSAKNRLLGYGTNVTEHIPSDLAKGAGTNLSAAILGDFSQVVIGLWKPGFEVVINPYDPSGKIALTIFMDVGFGLVRNEAFVRCLDLVA